MASTEQELRREIGEEREHLAEAVEALRDEIQDATNVGAKLQANLPVAAAAAFGAGFVLAGGIPATLRLLLGRRD